VDSPLLELSISGAKGILFNITGGNDLSMYEVDEAARIITEAADNDANVIFGAVIDENSTGEVKCTVVAAGFEEQEVPAYPVIGSSAGESLTKKTFGVPSTEQPSDSEAAPSLMEAKSTKLELNEEELEVPAFMRKPISK
jgi:cell division protein FtsZ